MATIDEIAEIDFKYYNSGIDFSRFEELSAEEIMEELVGLREYLMGLSATLPKEIVYFSRKRIVGVAGGRWWKGFEEDATTKDYAAIMNTLLRDHLSDLAIIASDIGVAGDALKDENVSNVRGEYNGTVPCIIGDYRNSKMLGKKGMDPLPGYESRVMIFTCGF